MSHLVEFRLFSSESEPAVLKRQFRLASSSVRSFDVVDELVQSKKKPKLLARFLLLLPR
jgi:hypothetical protein